MRVLDTDVLVDVLRKRASAAAWLGSPAEQPSVPGFVVMELMRGCADKADLRRVLSLARLFPIVWPNEADCTRALMGYAALRLSSGISVLDCLIAATAVRRSATLVTFNAKHFAAVPSLTTEQPYDRA